MHGVFRYFRGNCRSDIEAHYRTVGHNTWIFICQVRVRVLSVGTAAPCFTAYNETSRIAACFNHLKTFMVFVAKGSRNSYSSVTVYSVRTCRLRARRAWRLRALNTLWSMASPYFLQHTLEQEELRHNIRRGIAQ